MSFRMRRILCAAGVFFLTALLCFGLIHNGHDWGDDFSQYLAQGAALLDGTFDAWRAANQFIVEHSPDEMGVSLCPWGFPLLLAATGRIFGDSLLVYKLLQTALLSLQAMLFYLLCARMLRPRLALVAGVCYGAGYSLLVFVNSLLSEPLFLMLVLLFFLLLQRFVEDERHGMGNAAAMGAVAFCAYLTRSLGVALLAALLLFQGIALLQRRAGDKDTANRRGFLIPNTLFATPRARIANLLPYCVFFALLALSAVALPQKSASTFYFLAHVSVESVLSNLLYYCRLLSGLFPFPAWMATPALLLCCGLAAYGLWQFPKKNLPLLLFGAGVFVLNAVFPWRQGVRYLLPVWPAFCIYALYGLDALLARIRLPRALAATLALCACLLFGLRSADRAKDNLANNRAYDSGPYSADAQAAFAFIRTSLPPDATVVFFKPRLLLLMTAHRGFRADTEPQAIAQGDYYLYTSDYGEVDFSLLQENLRAYNANGGSLRLIPAYSNARFRLYRVATD